MLAAPGPGEADAALFDLGWGELLAAAPSQGAAMAFAALGATGSSAGHRRRRARPGARPRRDADDVRRAPPPTSSRTAGQARRRRHPSRRSRVGPRRHRRHRDRGDRRQRGSGCRTRVRRRGRICEVRPVAGLDPGSPYRRVVVDLPADTPGSFGGSLGDGAGTNGAWEQAVAAGRVALAHQLIAGLALDARRGPDPRRRPRAVRSIGGIVPGRAPQARRVARGDRGRGLGGQRLHRRRRPAARRGRQVARRQGGAHDRRPTPSRCWPASASRPTTSSTAG